MAKAGNNVITAEELAIRKIYFIRGQKVMLDMDLSEMYGVSTKIFRQAVKRNIERFPGDFMFEMTEEEFKNWRSQCKKSNSDRMERYPPFCFTEKGVVMLSGIIKTETAILVDIQLYVVLPE